mmetsp:Transcript_11114/g.11203  ORF Transcript_11114/g.11203 Transcript_11114/m.11203 type:complete len:128 (+) Transcript_11114:1354-1737(+)
MKKNVNRIKVMENYFITNKTNGITVESLPKESVVNIFKNEFNSNINKDIEINDFESFQRTFIPQDNPDKCNKMDYSIGKNFNEEEEKQQGDNSFSMRNSFDVKENLRENQQDFKINKHNIMDNQRNH